MVALPSQSDLFSRIKVLNRPFLTDGCNSSDLPTQRFPPQSHLQAVTPTNAQGAVEWVLEMSVNGHMRTPKPLPSHLVGRPFTLAQALQAGVSRGRTRASDLWTPCHDVRLPLNVDVSLIDSCRAITSVTPGSLISHITAAKLHEFRLPARFINTQDIHLSKSLGQGRPQRTRVFGHELSLADTDYDVVQGIPVTSVQRTLLDIAQELSMDELVAIADQIVCAHNRSFGPSKLPLVEITELKSYVSLHRRQRGIRKLQAAMELVQVGVDSAPETQLRLCISRWALPKFICNFEIEDAAGNPKVAPDLSCPRYRTCAEYDGAHHLDPKQQSKDHDRNFLTASLGWHQAIINKNDMGNDGLVAITKIARMLVLGGWDDPNNLARQSLEGQLHVRKDVV